MGGEWAESGRSGAETPNFKTYKKMWWKSNKCPNTETKDERWMGAGRRLGGGWAEAGRSGAETLNFKNAKKMNKMGWNRKNEQTMGQHTRDGKEMGGGWAEVWRSGAETPNFKKYKKNVSQSKTIITHTKNQHNHTQSQTITNDTQKSPIDDKQQKKP
jgi:hypothetical protein